MFGDSEVLKIGTLGFVGKGGAGNPEDQYNYFLKSWILDQYIPENMQWKFGDMGSISSKKH